MASDWSVKHCVGLWLVHYCPRVECWRDTTWRPSTWHSGNHGLWLVDADHVTWTLASDWSVMPVLASHWSIIQGPGHHRAGQYQVWPLQVSRDQHRGQTDHEGGRGDAGRLWQEQGRLHHLPGVCANALLQQGGWGEETSTDSMWSMKCTGFMTKAFYYQSR